MNEARYGHSQCVLGEFVFVFFGRREAMTPSSACNTIEYLNISNVINSRAANWSLIELQTDIQARYLTLATQIDDNEIAILGGLDKNANYLGEVLHFDA